MFNREALEPSVIAKIDAVEGWLTEREATFLYHCARTCPPGGVIVEIGSFKGKSTVCLGLGSLAGGRNLITAIDPHETDIQKVHAGGQSTLPVFFENVDRAGIGSLVTQVPEYSQQVGITWERPISFLWIDGDHTYEGALKDAVLFGRWVVDGGVVAFHDATQGELPRVVCQVFRFGYRRLGMVDSIVYGEKRNDSRKTLRDVCLLTALAQWSRLRVVSRRLRILGLLRRIFRRTGN